MRRILLFVACMLIPYVAMGQSERPLWVNGFHTDCVNSYLDVFTAVGSNIDEAKTKAVQNIADERSRATGRRYHITDQNGCLSISSEDELTVKCRIVDEYSELLSTGVYKIFLLVQTAKHPELVFEPVSVTNKYPISARVLVPGMAQLHKGSTTKGIAFIVAELAAVGGIVAFEGLRSSYDSKINTTKDAKKRQDYIDDRDNMQNLRNAFIAGAVAVYAWNIVDGIVAKGKKHVEVGSVAMRFAPFATPDAAGLAMNIQF